MQKSEFFCVKVSQRKNLPFLSEHLRQIFDDLYQYRIMGWSNLGSSAVDDTAVMLWATLHSHDVMEDLSKREIKFHPSITYIFF